MSKVPPKRFFVLRILEHKVICGRWLVDFDYIDTNSMKLIQFGSSPIKFICKAKPGKATQLRRQFPTFLVSSRWSVKFNYKNIYFGTTTKPFDVGKLWRKICSTSAKSRNTATTKKTNLQPTMLVGS